MKSLEHILFAFGMMDVFYLKCGIHEVEQKGRMSLYFVCTGDSVETSL